MGSLSGVTSFLTPLLGVPGAVISAGAHLIDQQKERNDLRAQQQNALQQLQARQAQEEALATQNAALEKQKLEADAQATEDRRKLALRRAVARQKTLFSAQGLGGAQDGSGEAVLLGLVNDSNTEATQDNQITALKNAALDQSLEQRRQKNLLESSQMAESQNLTRILKGY